MTSKDNAAQGRTRAASGKGNSGSFATETKPEGPIMDLNGSHTGPTSWQESFEASAVMRDWEDRLQVAEGVNEALDMAHKTGAPAPRVLALDYARSDDYEDYYTATVFDGANNDLGTITVPGYTFRSGSVPEDFRADASTPGDAWSEQVDSIDMTIDVDKVRAFDWDGEQDKVLSKVGEIATRALANHRNG